MLFHRRGLLWLGSAVRHTCFTHTVFATLGTRLSFRTYCTAGAFSCLTLQVDIKKLVDKHTRTYEGCSLILVIDSFSHKPSSLPEENYLVVIDRFFAILKSPTDFKMIQFIMAN